MIAVRPISLKDANRYVAEHHSHHKPVVGHKFSTSAVLFDEPEMPLVGAVIVSRPVAPPLDDGRTLEVTRLCCRGNDKNVASKLLGAATQGAEAQGYIRVVSYTRKDEDGTCYKAAGWVPVAETPGREWTSGNKATRWLPGFYEPTTEIVDRIRWEWRPAWTVRAVCKCIAAMGRWAALWLENKRQKEKRNVGTDQVGIRREESCVHVSERGDGCARERDALFRARERNAPAQDRRRETPYRADRMVTCGDRGERFHCLTTLSAPWFIRLEYERGEWQFNRPRDGQ